MNKKKTKNKARDVLKLIEIITRPDKELGYANTDMIYTLHHVQSLAKSYFSGGKK